MAAQANRFFTEEVEEATLTRTRIPHLDVLPNFADKGTKSFEDGQFEFV